MKLSFTLFLANIFIVAVYLDLLSATQQEVIDKINNVRRSTDPLGANMRVVQWSDCYARIALEYLQQCDDVDAYNSYRQDQAGNARCEASDSVGETIYNPPAGDTTSPIDVWASEGDFYNFAENSCSGPSCRNYLQLVNAETYLVGCVMFDQMDNCGRTGETFLCNFGIANGPYIEGTECSRCDDEFPFCNEGLCSQTAITEPAEPNRHNHQRGHKSHDHNHGNKNHDHAHDRVRGDKDNANIGNMDPKNHNHERGHKKHDHNHGDKKHDHAHDRGRRVRDIDANINRHGSDHESNGQDHSDKPNGIRGRAISDGNSPLFKALAGSSNRAKV